MALARTRCPECLSVKVVDLAGILYSPRVDFFRCATCLCWWMLPTNADEPVTRMILGDRKTSENKQAS
jgi:hypothetical protein